MFLSKKLRRDKTVCFFFLFFFFLEEQMCVDVKYLSAKKWFE